MILMLIKQSFEENLNSPESRSGADKSFLLMYVEVH